LYATVLAWTQDHLRERGYGRPLCKRLAVLLTGLLAGERATLSHLAARVRQLTLSPAREPSIQRRLTRLLDDPRLDPPRVLADVLASLLPRVLAPLVARPLQPTVGTRTPWVRLVVDETCVADRLHVLVVGLVVPGLALPLAVRCWRQNTALPPGTYWTELSQACWQIQALLPAAVRGHVLLLADRAYGVPQFVDLCRQLGWHYVVRAQGQIHVRLQRQGRARPLRTLVPRPGTAWYGGWLLAEARGTPFDGDEATPWVFHKAGWRRCQVAAAWAVGQAEPWLVLTDLSGTPDQIQEYARRWTIERLFLSWKSHGWDLEACGMTDPARLARLVSGLALATWWRLAFALPQVDAELDRLPGAPAPTPTGQLPLPWLWAPRPDRRPRPWLAKFSLLTWGAKVLQGAALRWTTPPLRWSLPDWTAPSWLAHCARVASAALAP
jgi:hypothetical protein